MCTPVLTGTIAPRLLLNNTAALMLAYAVPRVFTFVAGVAAARILGTERYGLYTTAAALAVVASIVATLGMHSLLVREIARAPADASSLVSAAHFVKLGTVMLMAALLVAISGLGFPPVVIAATALLAVGYAIGAFADNLAAYFQGIEAMYVWTQASALFGVISGAAGILAVAASGSLLWFCAAPALGQAAALGWLLHSAPRAIRRPSLPSRRAVITLLRKLVPFAVAFIGTTIFYRGDILVLAWARSPEEVGLYGSANRLLDVIQALAIAAAGALLPHLSRTRSTKASGTLGFLGLFAVAGATVACTLFVFREPIIVGFYGTPYAAAAPLLAVLAPVSIPRVLNMFALVALAGADAMWTASLAYIAASVTSLGLNLLLVPIYGGAGAAAVALATESVLAIVLVRALLARSAP